MTFPPPTETYDEFLARYNPEDWRKDFQSVAADVAVLTVGPKSLQTLLVRRTEWPHYGQWVFPGGFVRGHDTVTETLRRVLKTKLGMTSYLAPMLLQHFDLPDRDTRLRVISALHLVRCGPAELPATDGVFTELATITDGGGVLDRAGDRIHRLAYDHDQMLAAALTTARAATKLDVYWPVPMISKQGSFTIPDLHRTLDYLGAPMNIDALRRKVDSDQRAERSGWVEGGSGKPLTAYSLTG